MNKTVTMANKPITLVGRKIKLEQNAPRFTAVNGNLEEVTLDNFTGKIKVITSFVSLDTPTCDLQVKAFNSHAVALSPNVVVLGMSKDLPFAQKRFCTAFALNKINILSDYQTSSFGINYGLLIRDNNLLTRATIIIDANNIIRFIDVVDELTHEPNYKNILTHLNEVINSPPHKNYSLGSTVCTPCAKGTPPLEKNVVAGLMSTIVGWELNESKELTKEFKFKDFIQAKYFLDLLAVIAEEQGHHPEFSLNFNRLKVTLTTHAAKGLTMNDFIMAKIIDEVSF